MSDDEVKREREKRVRGRTIRIGRLREPQQRNTGNRGTGTGFPRSGLDPKTPSANRGARAARHKQSIPLRGLVRHTLVRADWLSQRSILNPQGDALLAISRVTAGITVFSRDLRISYRIPLSFPVIV
jgi:hypothetical protein